MKFYVIFFFFSFRYVGLTAQTSGITSLIGQICEQVSVLTTGTYAVGPHVSIY